MLPEVNYGTRLRYGQQLVKILPVIASLICVDVDIRYRVLVEPAPLDCDLL